jgi:small subunit ribosomal protein S7
MSRRKKSIKRPILPDARYDSQTVSKFINAIMYQGKKSTAERIFYGAMDIVENKTSQPGVTIFKQALTNLKPAVEVKSRRVGGATYQVPVEVRPDRRTALADHVLTRPQREVDGREARRRSDCGQQGRGQRGQEEGRHPPHG